MARSAATASGATSRRSARARPSPALRARPLARGGAPGLAAPVAGGPEVDAALVARAADEGDAACQRVLDRAWVAIGAMCAGLVNVLNPEVIVLGGSIAVHRPELLRARPRRDRPPRLPDPGAARADRACRQFADDVSLIGMLPIVNERLQIPPTAGPAEQPGQRPHERSTTP